MPEQYRRCHRCHLEKPLDDFHRSKSHALGHKYACKACESQRQKSPEARERSRVAQARRYQESRARLNAMKDRPCTDCGGRFPPVAMDFDHPEPGRKAFTVGDLLCGGFTDRFLAELAKCDLVCANCHRIRTYQQQLDGTLKLGRPRRERLEG